jgi:hypothetical protein
MKLNASAIIQGAKAITEVSDMATGKCQHLLCSCQVEDKNYCGEKCERAPKSLPGKCPCEHSGCKGH